MRRVIFVFSLIYLSIAMLLFLDDDARSTAAACGVPPPTATHGPPTATPVAPTASPYVHPTADLASFPFAKAPAGLHAIAACETRDQVRAMLDLLLNLLEGWELVPIGPGLPPVVILVSFEDPADQQRTIGLGILGDDPMPDHDGSAAQRIAWEYEERSASGASIATDSELVWMHYEQDGRPNLTWGAIGGARTYTANASYPADLAMLVDALARAAEHACYPDCQ
jgi:hypothetical protein